MNVYRPSRVLAFIIVLTATPFAVFGSAGLVFGIQMGTTDWCGYLFYLGFSFVGSAFNLLGLFHLGCRVETNMDGFSRISFFGLVVIHDSWESLSSSTVSRSRDDELSDPRFVEFVFDRRPGPIRIDAFTVFSPGLDKFLEDLRSRVGWKEIPELPDIQKWP